MTGKCKAQIGFNTAHCKAQIPGCKAHFQAYGCLQLPRPRFGRSEQLRSGGLIGFFWIDPPHSKIQSHESEGKWADTTDRLVGVSVQIGFGRIKSQPK
jgi:hypothetical protein